MALHREHAAFYTPVHIPAATLGLPLLQIQMGSGGSLGPAHALIWNHFPVNIEGTDSNTPDCVSCRPRLTPSIASGHVEPHVRETKLGLLERIGSLKAKTTPAPSLLTASQPERESSQMKRMMEPGQTELNLRLDF